MKVSSKLNHVKLKNQSEYSGDKIPMIPDIENNQIKNIEKYLINFLSTI